MTDVSSTCPRTHWCDGGVTQRPRRCSLADKDVQTAKRRADEDLLSQVYVGNTLLENVYSFEYLGARLQCDGADDAITADACT